MIQIVGIDKYLERSAAFMLCAAIEHDVVDGYVHRMIHARAFQLVGRPFQHLRPFQFFVHLDNFGLGLRFPVRFAGRLPGTSCIGFIDPIVNYFPLDFHGFHSSISRTCAAGPLLM
ncbi:hypothetical protein MnTg04_00101 [bacterium MnTg04]|nr:hypothetical protein MnTg04_00101 [bacterium MnTg04]